MPCDTIPRKRGSRRRNGTVREKDQTLSERKEEVRAVVKTLDGYLVRGLAKVVIGRQGAVAFQGFPETEKDGVSDACAYRLLQVTGSSLAKAAIARAEAIAGRTVDRKVIAAGIHSHDSGASWSTHKH